MSVPRTGFTLAEVVVATVILEVGLLGALSLVVLAARTLEDARRLETAVVVASGLADSLELAGPITAGSGVRSGRASRWAPDSAGFTVRVQVAGDASIVVHGSPVLDGG